MAQPPPGPDSKQKGSNDETLADWLEERAKEHEQIYGLAAIGVEPNTHCSTGIKRLDDAGLLELGVATIILGHEGDGKSALGLQLLEGCAKSGYSAVGFWPEDPRRFIADRVFAPLIGESATKLRRVRVDDPASIPRRLRLAATSAEWAKRIGVVDRRLDSKGIITEAKRRWTKDHRLLVMDYAQVLTAEGDEKSVERVINGFVWEANDFAKEHNAAVVIMSQVSGKVKLRGRDQFDAWKRNQNKPPTLEAVEGYRPLSGDAQWAPTALGAKARSIVSWFRPKQWLREHGADVPDDMAQALILKNNYGESKKTVTLRWHGPTTRISDPKE